jgi:predicted component of type VI protein secretion system
MDKEKHDVEDSKTNAGVDNISIANESESAVDTIGKDIKKGMDRYEARIKSAGEEEAPPAGDSTRSEE